jgi:hypothetical protein
VEKYTQTKGGHELKAGAFVSICVVFVGVLLHAGVCAGKKMIPVDAAMKEFEGIYVNTEYSGQKTTHPQKFVITSDGRMEDWPLAAQKSTPFKGEYKVVQSWMDSKGNIYCTVDTKYKTGCVTRSLWKLNESRDILEVNYTETVGSTYPETINPKPRSRQQSGFVLSDLLPSAESLFLTALVLSYRCAAGSTTRVNFSA